MDEEQQDNIKRNQILLTLLKETLYKKEHYNHKLIVIHFRNNNISRDITIGYNPIYVYFDNSTIADYKAWNTFRFFPPNNIYEIIWNRIQSIDRELKINDIIQIDEEYWRVTSVQRYSLTKILWWN